LNTSQFLAHLRALLLLLIWIAVLVLLFWRSDWLVGTTTVTLLVYISFALFICRWETLLVSAVISGLAIWLVGLGTDVGRIFVGLERGLLFAALMPTLQMVRAVASRMPSVQRSQERLSAMPGHWGDIGILVGSQAFGAVMNTGSFAILSAVIPRDASAERRRFAALASLRGMNIGILWSPFFVGFAVISTYIPTVEAWQIMGLGLILMLMCLSIGLLMYARPLSWRAISVAVGCLAPILPRMGIAAGVVVACSLLTPLSTLASVLVVMPVLMLVQFLRRPGLVGGVACETTGIMGAMGNDIVLVSSAMMLGAVGEVSPHVREALLLVVGPGVPAPLLLAAVIFIQTGLAVIGVHVLVTGTILVALLGGMPTALHEAVLFQGLLVGWSLGSMISLSSLSVTVAGSMYNVPPLRLAYGPNLRYALVISLFGVAVLSLLNWAVTGKIW
jgi:hypothetical protein